MKNLSVGAKLALACAALVLLVFAAVGAYIVRTSNQALQDSYVNQLSYQTQQVIHLLTTADKVLRESAQRLLGTFVSFYPEMISLESNRSVEVAGVATPALLAGDVPINGDFSRVDDFTRRTGAVATVFARQGEDFFRVTTSVKKENGERALGTKLDRAHPGYQKLLSGEPYVGRAVLFGTSYMTHYQPIKDASGAVIGSFFVGVDIGNDLQAVREEILSVKLAETGYFFGINAAPGKDLGKSVLHPVLEGQNHLALKDADGKEFVREMLERKQGVIRYRLKLAERGETAAREKIATFAHFPNWNWVVGGGVYTDEIQKSARALGRRLVFLSALAATGLALLIYLVTRALVTRPLQTAVQTASRVAQGDLMTRVASAGRDETGLLMASLADMQQGLASAVRRVRDVATTVHTAANQFVAGGDELSRRTETQASSTEETAATLEQVTSTVKQTAHSAASAERLAQEAAQLASTGGKNCEQLVQVMGLVKQSSASIGSVIAVIDAIAFQTNILALNAAVEAARAGASGRGFGVVADEVRSLAQRAAASAKEIKQLVNTSSEQTMLGVNAASTVQDTIGQIVTAVQRLAADIQNIALAAREQSAGLEQVNQAIVQVDNATQQNATLVEEFMATAQKMQEEASALVASVGVFQLGDSAERDSGLLPQVLARSSVNA